MLLKRKYIFYLFNINNNGTEIGSTTAGFITPFSQLLFSFLNLLSADLQIIIIFFYCYLKGVRSFLPKRKKVYY